MHTRSFSCLCTQHLSPGICRGVNQHSSFKQYGRSKLMNQMTCRELGKRLNVSSFMSTPAVTTQPWLQLLSSYMHAHLPAKRLINEAALPKPDPQHLQQAGTTAKPLTAPCVHPTAASQGFHVIMMQWPLDHCIRSYVCRAMECTTWQHGQARPKQASSGPTR